MTLQATRSTLPNFWTISIPQVENFNRFHYTASRFFVTGHFETSASMTQNDVEHYQVKCTQYMSYEDSQVANFTLRVTLLLLAISKISSIFDFPS